MAGETQLQTGPVLSGLVSPSRPHARHPRLGSGPRSEDPTTRGHNIRLPSADFPQQQQQSSPQDQDKVRCLEAVLIILIDGMQIREKSCYNSPAGDVLLIILLLSSF